VRRLLLACPLLIALALPATAHAKGPVSSLQVCGSDGCFAVPVPAVLRDPMGLDQLMTKSRALSRQPAPQSFYRLRIGFGDAFLTVFYLPGGTALQNGSWVKLRPRLSGELDRAVGPLAPFQVRLVAVRIQGRQVPDAQAYRPLLGRLPVVRTHADVARSIGLYLQTSTATPWGLGRVVFALYDRHTHVVDIAGTAVRPPPGLQHAIEQDAGIAPAGGGSASLWGGGVAAVAASAAAVVLTRRRHAFGRRR
jgi:hypothetical protein